MTNENEQGYKLSDDGTVFERYFGDDLLFNVPKKVVTIKDGAFKGNKELRSITLPKSVEEIGKDAFDDCLALQQIVVAKTNVVFRSRYGVLFTKDFKTLLKYPEGRDRKNYLVPERVWKIENNAFRNCRFLKTIGIPESAKLIADHAFDGCDDLTIFAPKDSNAEEFAWMLGIKFEPASLDRTGIGAVQIVWDYS